MNRLLASLFILCGTLTSTYGQNLDFRRGFEFSGNASVGMFGLSYKPTIGSQSNGPGTGIGVGFGWFLNPHWGISTGANLSLYTAFSKVPEGYSFSMSTYDSDGLPYDLKFKTTSIFKERDKVYSFEIPLLIHYRYYLKNQNALYIAGGMKYVFPFSGHSYLSKGSVVTSGYYENLGAELTNLPWLGFTSNDLSKSKNQIPLKRSFNASLEIGYLYNLSQRTFLSFSLFSDVGLTNLRKNYTQRNLIYSYSQYNNIPCSNLVSDIKLFTIGIKGAIHFNINPTPLYGQKRVIEQPATKNEKITPAPSENHSKSRRSGR
jgi:hypothetical protein